MASSERKRVFRKASNVEDKLIKERAGLRSNALLAYEKESHQQNMKVTKILGPPAQNKNVEEKNDVTIC